MLAAGRLSRRTNNGGNRQFHALIRINSERHVRVRVFGRGSRTEETEGQTRAVKALAHVGSSLRVEADEEEDEAAVPGVEGHVPWQGVRGCSAQQEAHAAVEGVRMSAGGRGRGGGEGG